MSGLRGYDAWKTRDDERWEEYPPDVPDQEPEPTEEEMFIEREKLRVRLIVSAAMEEMLQKLFAGPIDLRQRTK